MPGPALPLTAAMLTSLPHLLLLLLSRLHIAADPKIHAAQVSRSGPDTAPAEALQ